MKGGVYTERATVQKLTVTEDGGGSTNEAWVDLGVPWCRVVTERATDQATGAGEGNLVTHKVTMRYLTARDYDLKAGTHRLLWDDQGTVRVLNLKAISPDEKRKDVFLACEEVTA